VRPLRRAQVATWVLTCALPLDDAEAVVGDLEEEVASRRRSSEAWYWAQVLRSVLPLFALGMVRGGWLSTVGVALVACICQAVVEFVAASVAWELGAGRSRWFVPATLALTLPSLVWLSYQATRIRPAAGLALAAVAAVTIGLRLWLVARSGAGLPGRLLAALVAVPLLAVAGGFLAQNSGDRRTNGPPRETVPS
jgi:hypothetical protein